MRRPGYLNDWEDDFYKYMKAKYPGWQSQQLDFLKLPEPKFHVFSSPYFPISHSKGPMLLHPKHGLVPEADVIASTLQLKSGPGYTPPNGLPS
jgi:hypothetical protein